MCKGVSLNFTTAISAAILRFAFLLLPPVRVINGSADHYLCKAPAGSSWSTAGFGEFPGAESSPDSHTRLGSPGKAAPGPPPLGSVTNTPRELGAQLLPGPATFQLFHNRGNARRNPSELLLGPFPPRGLTFNRIYITNTALL